MATLTYTFENVSLVSRWTVQVNSANGKLYFSQNPTQANRSISFDVTGLAAGAIINSAKLSFSAGSPSTGAALFRYKNNQTGTYTNLSTGQTNSIDIPLAGNGTVSGELQFKAYGSKNQGLGSHSATLGISNIKLVIDYVAYTAPTAPTAVSVASTNVAPGASVQLSWSGAAAGTNNAITGYHIHRATSASGSYSYLTEVSTSATSGSVNVTAPTANDSSYYYKVYTKATQNDYLWSAASTAYATLTCYYTVPSAPTSVTINDASSIYLAEGSVATLKWSGASAGTNNAISSYLLYVDDTLYGETPSSTSSVNIPSYGGGEHKWKVITKGAYSNSAASSTASCFTYTATGAPTSVSLAATTIDAGTSTTLSWSGAKAGTYNTITGYHIYRSTAENGTYSLAYNVSSTSTAASTSVAAPSTMGQKYYYKVYTIGSRNLNSGPSSAVSLTAQTYSYPTAPTSVSISANNVAPGATVTLSWSGASNGTNNPITEYHVHRATASNGEYSYLTSVSASTTSINITAPTTNGSSYYYKIYSKATNENYLWSSPTSAVSLTCSFSAPSAPTSITINDASSVYIGEGSTATLKWSGASAGTNNAITGYLVYVGDSLYADVGSSATSTSVPSYGGGEHKWKVVTKGAYSNSAASSTVSCFTYTATSAPTSVSLAATTVDAGASTTLSWSGAKAGIYNAITGYHVYRATSENGAYSVLTAVESTSTAANTTVNAPSTMGNKYYYKVYTIGARNYNSGASSVVSLTAQTYSAPSAPTSLSLNANNVDPGATVTLSWSGATAGTNNAITGYKVYRSTDQDGTYELLSTVNSTATSGNLSVTAPSETSSAFYYKIITVGTKSGFLESGYSSVIALQTKAATPTPPTTISVQGGVSWVNSATTSRTITWSGASGGDGAITGYNVYRASNRNSTYNKVAEVSTSSTSSSVALSFSEPATTYYIRVSTVGALGESAQSASVYINYITPPQAPTNIMVSKTLSDGASVSLSWDTAEAGYNNPAGSYTVYRSESTDGSTWGTESQITSEVGDTSITITPPTAYGNYYRYKVIATGTYDGSASSAAYSSNTLRRDHAPIAFAENIMARETNVRAQHMTELQNTIAMLLEFYGLDAQTMSTITAGTTPISSWTGHVNEIRAAIDFLTTYHDEWLEIPVNVPRADVMNQLRNVLLYVEKPQCVLGVGKLGAIITR